MGRILLTTVGASLLNNAKRDGLDVADETKVLKYISDDPRRASAETNSLSQILQEGDEVVLLHSDTEEGAKAADLLESFYKKQGVPCNRVRIAGLTYEAQGFVDFGLKNFVRTLAGEIRKAANRGKEVIINATGGFKAEIAYATVLGLLFKVHVYYIHERFQEVVVLPPAPMGWDSSLFLWHREFFDWLSQGESGVRLKAEVQGRLASLPQEAQVLLEEFDLQGKAYVGLSPLGEAYFEAFLGELEQARSVPIYLSRKARRTWEDLDPSSRERYRRILENLRLPHRTAQSEFKSGGGDALGYPKGHVDERVFYAEKDGALYVFALTRHGPEYDRMCRKGFYWKDFPPEDFDPWEG